MLSRSFFIILIIILFISNQCSVSISNADIIGPIVKDSIALTELGQHLFFDKRLSFDESISCSTCHNPELAFTDGYKVSVNSKAESLLRNSPSLLNINHRTNFNWANPNLNSLIDQMQRPLYGTHPIELGVRINENKILDRIMKQKVYQKLVKKVYHQSGQKINTTLIEASIALYITNLQSRNSRYDQFLNTKDSSKLSKQEWRGHQLFHSDSIECNACHGGLDFFEPDRGPDFANIGLYNCNGSYPERDRGVQNETKNSDDNGDFRIPTLRNIAITAPYYHDGSEESLERVIHNYENTGRNITYGDCQGDGAQHPNLNGRLQKFTLSNEDRMALISFLQSLTDTSYLKNRNFVNPFFSRI